MVVNRDENGNCDDLDGACCASARLSLPILSCVALCGVLLRNLVLCLAWVDCGAIRDCAVQRLKFEIEPQQAGGFGTEIGHNR